MGEYEKRINWARIQKRDAKRPGGRKLDKTIRSVELGESDVQQENGTEERVTKVRKLFNLCPM